MRMEMTRSELMRAARSVRIAGPLVDRLGNLLTPFPGSARYWQFRYKEGGSSGAGSYGRLAQFKSEVLNKLVAHQDVKTVVEFGCGDGNQLLTARYPQYIGLDV